MVETKNTKEEFRKYLHLSNNVTFKVNHREDGTHESYNMVEMMVKLSSFFGQKIAIWGANDDYDQLGSNIFGEVTASLSGIMYSYFLSYCFEYFPFSIIKTGEIIEDDIEAIDIWFTPAQLTEALMSVERYLHLLMLFNTKGYTSESERGKELASELSDPFYSLDRYPARKAMLLINFVAYTSLSHPVYGMEEMQELEDFDYPELYDETRQLCKELEKKKPNEDKLEDYRIFIDEYHYLSCKDKYSALFSFLAYDGNLNANIQFLDSINDYTHGYLTRKYSVFFSISETDYVLPVDGYIKYKPDFQKDSILIDKFHIHYNDPMASQKIDSLTMQQVMNSIEKVLGSNILYNNIFQITDTYDHAEEFNKVATKKYPLVFKNHEEELLLSGGLYSDTLIKSLQGTERESIFIDNRITTLQ